MQEEQRAAVTPESALGSPPPIRADGLVKRFGDVEAVAGASFEVQRGEVFGLLGPNGAGKTTTIRILTTLLLPTAGIAEVAGYNVVTHPGEVRRRIGLVFQEPSLDESLTARENLFFHARLYGMTPDDANARIDAMLELVELSHRASHLVKTFSGGMRRRLEVARALLHRPAVLFLDEPTTGLESPNPRPHMGVRPRFAHPPRNDGAHDDALYGRGGALRPHRHYGQRADHRPRHTRSPEGPHRRLRADLALPRSPASCGGAERGPCSFPAAFWTIGSSSSTNRSPTSSPAS